MSIPAIAFDAGGVMKSIVEVGLKQFSARDLRRVVAHKGPMLLDGNYVDPTTGVG